jgi:hypothetical protein
LLSIGVALPVHEKPKESPTQPPTVVSRAQPEAVVALLTQQYWLDPPLCTPVLQRSESSFSSGRVSPVHEKPNDGLAHPLTDLSAEHAAATKVVLAQQ